MSLPRYRPIRRLRPIGRTAIRKAPQRRLAYAAVARRAAGRCELCGHAQDPLDPHHTFGRGHLPGIPARWCDTPELILGICRTCHDEIHGGDTDLLEQARWRAIRFFVDRHGLNYELSFKDESLEVMRELVRQLEERTG